MQPVYQKYLDNLTEANSHFKQTLRFSPSDQNSLLEQIQAVSQRTFQLRTENDKLLQEILYSRKAEDLTEEDVKELQAFADELFVFAHQNDIGTAYRIHQFLYEYAEWKGDRDLCIRQLYHMGSALFYMNPMMVELGVNLFGNKVTEYFRAGASHLPHYEEIENAETRSYILRCLTNLCITDEPFTCKHQPGIPYNNISTFSEYRTYFDQMMELYHSPRHRAITPDFPWDTAIYNLHFNLSLYYQFVERYHPPEIIQDILNSATYTYRHQEQIPKFKYSTKEMRVEQIYATIRWKAGLISTTELADTLYDLIARADPNDFSLNGITLNLQMPLHFEHAYRNMTNEERKLYTAKMKKIDENSRSYLLRAPRNEFTNLVTKSVGESIRYRAQHNLPLQKQFFDSLLFCHPPTYIHVRMAATLSKKLFLRLVEVSPEKLIGLYDIYDTSDLLAQKEELAERVYLCSLYHDVGKIMLLDYVGIYERKLLDEEFESIKLHTSIGAALLEKTDPKELSVIALHHHRFYNEMGGYPEVCPPCPPQYKPIVDIVSVSDSIEAATDNIGRCYSTAKSFRTLVDELRAERGTRYSPAVVSLFDDEEFFQQIERELHQDRVAIYYETYGSHDHNH